MFRNGPSPIHIASTHPIPINKALRGPFGSFSYLLRRLPRLMLLESLRRLRLFPAGLTCGALLGAQGWRHERQSHGNNESGEDAILAYFLQP